MAYELVGGPIIVGDIAAGLVKLKGLPGPFIKFFETQLGADALFKLATKSGDAAIVTCTVAYFDGSTLISVRGEITGTVVSARGNRGFGFDLCFVPDGAAKTFAEMTAAEKDSLSHRSKAVAELVRQLHKM